ncbi:MAG: hypothetical protein R3F07_15945 [Opitutaceae bacterium]
MIKKEVEELFVTKPARIFISIPPEISFLGVQSQIPLRDSIDMDKRSRFGIPSRKTYLLEE